MLRTQLYIPQPMHMQLTQLAMISGQPMAELVRQFIKDGLSRHKHTDYSGKQALRNIINLKLKGGPKDLSVRMDHYLYDTPSNHE